MVVDEFFTGELKEYENSLSKQFRLLEGLLEISKKERELILQGSTDALMKNTEEKEAALDKFSLLEENSRMFLQNMALRLQLQSDKADIQEILTYLKPDDSNRISRLLDGINVLVNRAREVNLGNQALVLTRIDWLKATRSFIVSLAQKSECYTKPIMDGVNRNSTVSGLEFRA